MLKLKNYLSLLLPLSLSATMLAAPNTVFAKPIVTFRVYSVLNASNYSSNHVFFDKFQSILHDKYGDKIKFNYFPNGILGKEADAIQQVKNGAIDITLTGTSIWSTIVPEISVLDQGYLFSDFNEEGHFLDGKPGAYLSDLLLKEGNCIVLGYGYSLGVRNIYTAKPVKTITDLKSMKIRVLPVPGFIDTINHMGAVAIPMPGGEVYSGLQMGVIDGVEHDSPTVLLNKYYEVAKYGLESAHIYNPMLFAMNKSSFDRIPDDMKQGFLDAAREATNYERSQSMVIDKQARDELIKKGVTYTSIDKNQFQEAMVPVWDSFFSKNKKLVFMLDYIKNGKMVHAEK